jgi:hypothetical protein
MKLKRIRIEVDFEISETDMEELRKELEEKFKGKVYYIYEQKEDVK